MRRNKSNKDPLLYIHQSNSKTPEAYMQKNYATPKRIPVRESENHPSKQSNKRVIRRSSYFKSPYLDNEDVAKEEYTTIETASEEIESREQKRPSKNKKFKDMTLEEKVYYFADAPAISPKLRCEVLTNERSFRGRIVDFAENEVYMRVGRRISPSKIPLDNIRDIRLLGF